MRKLKEIFWIALAALAVVAQDPASANWPLADMNAQIDQTNFVVNTGCSGTLIDLENRYVLTANHCIRNQYETLEREIVGDDGSIKTETYRRLKPGTVSQLLFAGTLQVQTTVYRTKVIGFDSNSDLALIQIIAEIPNTVASRIACDEPVRGEPVFIVGNPAGTLYSSVVSGLISSVQRSYETINFGSASAQQEPLMQISGGVVGGNSGGAVYNVDGELVGVPVLANRTNETYAFAVPPDAIRAFLKSKNADDALAHCDQDASQ